VRELGIRSSLRSPIVIGGRTEFVLVVSWQTVIDEPDATTIAIVRRFADQAGLAFEQLERRRAEEQAAARADESERLQEITAELSLAATRGVVGDTCLKHALRFVGAEAGFVVLTGPGGTSVQMISSEGYSEDALEAWGALGRPRRGCALRTSDRERRARLGAHARGDGRLHGCPLARRRRVGVGAAQDAGGHPRRAPSLAPRASRAWRRRAQVAPERRLAVCSRARAQPAVRG